MNFQIIDGIVYLFDAGSDVPFLKRPTWPNGDEWQDGEAEAWATQAILALTDPTADLAGPDRENHPQPRPVEEPPVTA